MKNMSKILWGLVLVVVGLMMCINVLGIAHLDIFFDGWWTLFIIIPSFIGLFNDEDRYGSLIGLIIGVALLLSAQGVISFHLLFKLLVPFIVIMIGISVLRTGLFGKKVKEKVEIKNVDDLETIAVVMSDEHKVITGDFKGAVIDTVFGHCTIDLSSAKIKSSASLKISSVFAKVDIILPSGVTLKTDTTRVFGSISTVIKEGTKKEKEVVVYAEATAVFGGVSFR